MEIRTREVSPGSWRDVERLFGPRGACGGCWCQWWRVERGGALWERTKGAPAKAALKRQVARGEARGILAYAGGAPVGWCTFGPRADFPRLERVKAYRRAGSAGAWSIPCFYIAPGWRGKGVARALLGAAVAACRAAGASVVEGYPVTTTRDGRPVQGAFAWTGPLRIFEERGFETVQATPPTKPLVRKSLRAAGAGRRKR